ncbi:MAG: DUF2339 domain-containing protein [Clostridiales bacterium]|nr:DUF2339 domain-containing protein [Clostridiales bacterium]
MGAADKLKDIISRQREVLSELEAEQLALESSDLARENARLAAELEKQRGDFERADKALADLAEENANLKNTLYEQIYNEKLRFVTTTAQKLEVLFNTGVDGELDRLTAIESKARARIIRFRRALAKDNIDLRDDIYARLDELSASLDRKATEARAKATLAPGPFTREERDGLEALKEEQITDEQIRALAKKNNLERFVGLNVLNTVGIFLLIAGSITLARFAYVQLTDLLKGVMLYALGGLLLAAGEMLNRKKPNIFSLGLSAGGVGILFAALATSYFALHILDVYPAIAVCVLVTAAAFVLSNRYNSQTIAAFALIGGYLPMFSIGTDTAVAYGAMVYFVVLNLLALSLSTHKKWRISPFIGLFLNTAGTLYICMDSYGAPGLPRRVCTILYVLFAFLTYTAIPIVGAYRAKAGFRRADVVFLALNTFFSSLILFGVFYSFGLQDYHGALAVAFAAIYLLLGRFIEKRFAGGERHIRALFYLTGLAFVVLVIPLQFGRAWLSLGWLAQGVALAAYGVLRDEKSFRRAGLVICLLCLVAFVANDCVWTGHYLFVYKYSAITLGSLVLLGAYMYTGLMTGLFVKVYKYFALVNAWFFTMYLIFGKLYGVLYRLGGQSAYQVDYLTGAAAVTATFLLAYAFSRIRLLHDLGTRIVSVALHGLGILALALMNTALEPVSRVYLRVGTPSPGITAAGTAILLALGLLSVLALREIMKMLVLGRAMGVEWYPLVVSGYFVLLLTQNLITQYDLRFSNAAISIIYVLTALAWIVYGFTRRYSFVRRFGLGLAILSVIKLFLIDLAGLTQGYQIVSYFALGATLIAISFVYQYFSRRLELREEASADGEKSD